MTESDLTSAGDAEGIDATPPRSVHAVDGFFTPKTQPGDTAAISLFKRFERIPPSWIEFRRQFAQLSNGKENGNAGATRRLKTVYFVRHAEGTHNAADKKFGSTRWETELAFLDEYLDADLTAFGVNDAKSKGPPGLAAELAEGMSPIERVVVSPLSRAIQTAQNFFANDQVPDKPFIAIESCREVLGCHTCDKRRSVADLKQKFPNVDFSAITAEQDELWTATHRETDEEMQARAKEFLLELFREIPETNVAVVTHSGFMEAVCAVVLGIRIHPANCEVIPLVLEAV